jgi:predicted metal-binding membrane protein
MGPIGIEVFIVTRLVQWGLTLFAELYGSFNETPVEMSLTIAGLYQFGSFKGSCLRHFCSPFDSLWFTWP